MMSEEEARRRAMLRAFEGAQEEDGFAPPGYEIFRELAQGGMAVVYLARQLQPEREVALKMVLPKFADDAETCERFQREGKAMAALDHPGVLPVYQVGEWDGMPFLVMKLARGGSLLERLAEGLPEIRQAVEWIINAGEAVHFAHQRGVLHRDLKPGNLLFDDAGAIYVGDFGVAKLEFAQDRELTRTATFVGTPNYIAPEVAMGLSSGGNVAADLYGLGVVLYECLTGRRPHDDAANMAAQLRAVVDEEISPVRKIRPEIAKDLEVICMKALARDPEDRFGSVAEFVEDLQRWQDGREILSRPAGVLEKMWRWVRSHRLPAALLALLSAVLVTAAVQKLDNMRRQTELLHESLIKRARDERLVGEPGFRQRALDLLKEARKIQDSNRIREEAVAVLAHWDVGAGSSEWGAVATDLSASWKEEKEGLRILTKDQDWFLPGGDLRCEPTWSPDGRFLAVVRGERMEAVVRGERQVVQSESREVGIYDVSRRIKFARIAVRDWPERLIFGRKGERLKVDFDDGTSTLASVRGEVLLDGFQEDQTLLKPVGFQVWEGQYTSPLEVNPYGGKLSRDEKLLATTSAAGVQLWDVEKGRSVDFYEVENQHVEAPTDVWWIARRKLLLQVPGALEVLSLDDDGRVLEMNEFKRVPGTKVKDYRKNGDWVMETRTEEGTKSYILWPAGDSKRPRALSSKELAEVSRAKLEVPKTNVVTLGQWVLSLPYGGLVQQVIRPENSTKVIVITKDYRVCDWDLEILEEELKKQGF